jgi:hypothetical protein
MPTKTLGKPGAKAYELLTTTDQHDGTSDDQDDRDPYGDRHRDRNRHKLQRRTTIPSTRRSDECSHARPAE